MARRVFFSFHYESDIWRASQIRNSWVTKPDRETAGFWDSAAWEEVKKKGDDAVKRWIDNQLNATSVTVVLIGEHTHARQWVKYEIVKSYKRGNGILGIHINRTKDRDGYITRRGLNPLKRIGFIVSSDGKKIHFYKLHARRWEAFQDLPEINNKKSNSLYFEEGFIFKNPRWGNFYTFSEYFKTYCWDFDDGYRNLPNWVEKAAKNAGR